MVVNRTRGRSAFRLPDTVGPVEVVVYLFAPAVLALLSRNAELAATTRISPTAVPTVTQQERANVNVLATVLVLGSSCG